MHWFTVKKQPEHTGMCEEISGGVSRDFRLIPGPTAQRRVRLPEELLTYPGNRFSDYPDHLCNRGVDSWNLSSCVFCCELQIEENARARPSEGHPAHRET